MGKIKSGERSAMFYYMAKKAELIEETNDCSVRAIAIACEVEYEQAHVACSERGRKKAEGLSTHLILEAARSFGKRTLEVDPKTFIQKYPGVHKNIKHVTTHHMTRFSAVWKDGKKYLLFVRGHVLAVIDGVNHDWTVGRAKQVYKIVEII